MTHEKRQHYRSGAGTVEAKSKGEKRNINLSRHQTGANHAWGSLILEEVVSRCCFCAGSIFGHRGQGMEEEPKSKNALMMKKQHRQSDECRQQEGGKKIEKILR